VDRWNGNEGKGHTKVIYLLKTLDIIKWMIISHWKSDVWPSSWGSKTN
jgi:hypothetical protein